MKTYRLLSLAMTLWLKLLLLIVVFVFSDLSHAQNQHSAMTSPKLLLLLQQLYPKQSSSFLIERVKAADSDFNKWRAFAPLYYLLADQVTNSLRLKTYKDISGLCLGDAHLENFGFLYNPTLKKSQFTLNDFDDVSQCPLILDIVRLYIGHKIILDQNLNLEKLLNAYKLGLSKKVIFMKMPEVLEALENDSLKDGKEYSSKYKQMWSAKRCSADYRSATATELMNLRNYFSSLNKNIQFVCAYIKPTGGSAGLLRFHVFLGNANGVLNVVELKQLSTPAPLYNQVVGDRGALINQALLKFTNGDLKNYYNPLKLGQDVYLSRPLWKGDKGVDLKDLEEDKQSLIAVAEYEAHLLGVLHAKSLNPTNSLRLQRLQPSEIQVMAQQIQAAYFSLFQK